MRKSVSILLMPILLFNLGGYYLWFSALQFKRQEEVRQEIRKGLKEEDLTLFVVPAEGESGLHWIKPDKEFRYKGEMYDVVKIKTFQQKKYCYCLNDSKEKQLITHFNRSHNSKRDTEKKLKSGFSYSSYFPQYTLARNQYAVDLDFTAPCIMYSPASVDILSPPPKSA